MDDHTRQITDWVHTFITNYSLLKDQTRMEDHTRHITDITGFTH